MLIDFLWLLSASTPCADLPACSTRLGRVAMPRVLTKKRPTACSGGSTLRSTFVDQRHPEGSTAALSRSRATAGA